MYAVPSERPTMPRSAKWSCRGRTHFASAASSPVRPAGGDAKWANACWSQPLEEADVDNRSGAERHLNRHVDFDLLPVEQCWREHPLVHGVHGRLDQRL
jgi:hypothetical protein